MGHQKNHESNFCFFLTKELTYCYIKIRKSVDLHNQYIKGSKGQISYPAKRTIRLISFLFFSFLSFCLLKIFVLKEISKFEKQEQTYFQSKYKITCYMYATLTQFMILST